MSGPTSIPIAIESTADADQAWRSRLAILHEIRHGLECLAETGKNTKIDLSSIPLNPDGERRLLAMLGKGEVTADVDALGPTRVWESAIHGVWLLDYRNLDEQRVALHIEIAAVPDILRTAEQDIRDAHKAVEALIDSCSSS
jgi:hydrogenase-1 operon protein HyaF